MNKPVQYKLLMSFGNKSIKLEMYKSDDKFIIITKRYFFLIRYSKKSEYYYTFDEAEDRFTELKNEIKIMSLIK